MATKLTCDFCSALITDDNPHFEIEVASGHKVHLERDACRDCAGKIMELLKLPIIVLEGVK